MNSTVLQKDYNLWKTLTAVQNNATASLNNGTMPQQAVVEMAINVN